MLKSLLIGLAATVVAAAAPAQERPGPLTLTVHPLRAAVYWVEGGVANTGFIVGDQGVVLIDAQRAAEAARQELAEIAKITRKPVDTVILTHADPDHVCGLPALPAGTAVIAQENTKSELIASMNDPSGPPALVAMYRAVADHLPTRTIGSTETVVLDGVRMELIYVAPAHTSGDLIIYLPKAKVVFTGDIGTTNTGPYPVIHLGGSSLGWIAAMKAMLALDADTYVSGHGAIETKAMLRDRLRNVEERREQIKKMVNENRSLAEVEQALPDKPEAPMFPTFVQTTYAELTKGYPPASPPWTNLVHK